MQVKWTCLYKTQEEYVETYFPDDTYQTPEDNKKYIREKILLGNKKGFYWDYIRRIFWAARRARRGRLDYSAYCYISKRILQDIEGHGGRFNIKGLHHFQSLDEPVVLVANHMSVLETQMFSSLLAPKKIAFVVKESLISHPIFGPIMRSVYPIAVGRKNPIEDMKKVLQVGKEYLDQGISVIIFPEGTRRNYFNPNEFNSIGIKLALHSSVKIQPVALKTDYWGQGRILKDFGRIDRQKEIHVELGKAMALEGRGKVQHREIQDFLSDRLGSWGVPIQS